MEGMGNDSSPSLGQYEALSNLCGRRFWDPRQAWDTEDPVLGVCVERTVLVWVPCFLLWVFSPLYLSFSGIQLKDPFLGRPSAWSKWCYRV
ncbi:multidrug resistance-associated protein 1-like [Penaeus monodon]|uniref:multidrug resistance-associated protein 1-like n=1 Tax=Penaeus monodon TaxID=6687 RepID=UPI0018A7D4EB|nr:multidrug resistance-associated protein 1-like [Penaeus monodon]